MEAQRPLSRTVPRRSTGIVIFRRNRPDYGDPFRYVRLSFTSFDHNAHVPRRWAEPHIFTHPRGRSIRTPDRLAFQALPNRGSRRRCPANTIEKASVTHLR